jgi:hypothetical protein
MVNFRSTAKKGFIVIPSAEFGTAHSWQVALENLASIKAAVEMTPPDWKTALVIWEARLHIAIPRFPLFHCDEPGQAPLRVDQKMHEVRIDAERLREALKIRDRKMVDALLISMAGKLQALAARAVVV